MLAPLLNAGAVGAQCDTLDEVCENHAPIVAITPSSGTFAAATQPVSVHFSDDRRLDDTTMIIRVNNNPVTWSTSGGGTSIEASGTVAFVSGVNTIYARICDTGPLAPPRQRACTEETDSLV